MFQISPPEEVDADPEPSSSSRHTAHGRSPVRKPSAQRDKLLAGRRGEVAESSGSDTEPHPNHVIDKDMIRAKLLAIQVCGM